jgi:hypothetical protein
VLLQGKITVARNLCGPGSHNTRRPHQTRSTFPGNSNSIAANTPAILLTSILGVVAEILVRFQIVWMFSEEEDDVVAPD